MKILAIETSCDETAAAVVENGQILSNVCWTQTAHTQWGGVVPSIARRNHEERIGAIILEALGEHQVDAVAVTTGPGLAIALGVGISHAKALAAKLNKPLIAVNHIEGHILSALTPRVTFPCLALVVSGGHTELILVEKIGKYKILAQKIDDALGEALDKAARILGLGYPGGAELEKHAAEGDPKKYKLPLPMAGREDQNQFSYSGLKSAFFRLVSAAPSDVDNLAASFQNRAFEHLIRVTKKSISNCKFQISNLLVGGGVAANNNLRERLEDLGKELNIQVRFAPRRLFGDNAAMIGIAGYYKALRGDFANLDEVDRSPRWKIDQC